MTPTEVRQWKVVLFVSTMIAASYTTNVWFDHVHRWDLRTSEVPFRSANIAVILANPTATKAKPIAQNIPPAPATERSTNPDLTGNEEAYRGKYSSYLDHTPDRLSGDTSNNASNLQYVTPDLPPQMGTVDINDREWRGIQRDQPEYKVRWSMQTTGVWWQYRVNRDPNQVHTCSPVPANSSFDAEMSPDALILEWRIKPGQPIHKGLVSWFVRLPSSIPDDALGNPRR